MKDEIKEILEIRSVEQQAIDNLKAIISCDNKIIEIEPPLEDTAQILLDYITNLQEENERLNEENERLKEENERLKEVIQENDKDIDNLCKNQKKEIDRLNNIISETSKDIQHELSHLKANDEVSWNEEFYTNDKLDYRKLCIALLEQFVNKLKEKE